MARSNSRERRGALVCLAGVFCNFLLAAGKIAAGLISGFFSVAADGFNNLSDCGSGIVALVSFFIAGKPADREHPYGHRRAEYIASMIAGLLVLFLAAGLLREGISGVVHGGSPAQSLFVYAILGVSVAVKAGMYVLYRVYAKKLDSDSLRAAATDSLCDGLATAAVIAGAALVPVLPSADGWAGILVSLFIAWQGVKILAGASSALLGRAPDPALAEQIKRTALSTEGVLGVHDLQIYGYGKGVSFATLHAEMDATLTMLAAHAVIDGIETRVKKETGVLLTIHLDPVDLSNFAESSLRIKIGEAARDLTEGLELHDFRLIPDSNRVEFDIGIPYACKLSDDELHRALVSIVKEFGDYEPIVRIERE